MRGNITRRGKSSWRLKFDAERDVVTGKRQTRYVTVRGKRLDAERELARLLNEAHNGTLIDPSNLTVTQHLRAWLDLAPGLSPKTAERYRQLAEQQIIPHLGGLALQKLKPAHIQNWHGELLKAGGKAARPLSARTVSHAHRVLHKALQLAVDAETLYRNVAGRIPPPKVEAEELEILTPEEISDLLAKLDGHALYPIAAMSLATGMRRGELLALRWGELNLSGATLTVKRSLEETKAGLRFKSPKTKHGHRTISLPPSLVGVLRAHRRYQLELRIALGQGRSGPTDLVFTSPEGNPMSPDNLSRDWRRVTASRKLPRVRFHALRHTHASALIASGLDVLTISRRLGHASPAVTLTIYGHLFRNRDREAADVIEVALRTTVER
jgi:integrase